MNKKDKSIAAYNKLLNSFIQKKEFIKVEREFDESESDISGFLLANTDDFILLQKEEDFRLDGYAIIPKTCFDSIRNNKFDKTIKKILKKEGVIDKDYGIKPKYELNDWRSIFKSLQKQDQHVIIECEHLEFPQFVIGPIKRVNKKSVSIQYYDATGKLDEKATKVKYEDITIVRFQERYIKIFRKYLK